MNKSLAIAVALIVIVVAILLNNPATVRLDVFFTTFQQKLSLILLGSFVAGIITGLLLKGQ